MTERPSNFAGIRKRGIIQGRHAMSMMPARLFAAIACMALMTIAAAQAQTFEHKTQRYGSDIRSFDPAEPNARLCQQGCIDEPRCLAWTFDPPGGQLENGRCWLKPTIAQASFRYCCTSGVVRTAPSAAPGAGIATVKELAEKLGVIGTWAADCGQPASAQNPYVVYRALDAGHLQRDTMTGPSTRAAVSVADTITELDPGQLIVSWPDDKGRVINVVHQQGSRGRLMESVRDTGEKLYENGRRVRDNLETKWFSKCG